MSELIVQVVTIDEIRPHPDPEATRIELAIVKGWQTVVPVGKYEAGDTAIYVPPDAMIPPDVAEHWGVTNHLGSDGRVRCARLRGAMSFGFLADVEGITYRGFGGDKSLFDRDPKIQVTMTSPQIGEDVAEYYGITKWEPAVTFNTAELEKEHPAFRHYTDIQNFENFPWVIREGEEVVITEKSHGTNSRSAKVRSLNENDPPLVICGTHEHQVIMGIGSVYEMPLGMESVRNLLDDLYDDNPGCNGVILYGEIYGQQTLKYGLDKGRVAFLAFDISIDGEMMNWDDFVSACQKHGVPIVPVLYRGPFSSDILREMSGGNTVIGGDHIKEGVVVHPVIERNDLEIRRVILKRISDQYRLKADRISDSH